MVKFSSGGNGFKGRGKAPTEEQATAREDRLRAQEQSRRRKLDARRKIVMGGCFIAMLRENPHLRDEAFDMLSSFASEKDRKILDAFKKDL